MQAGVRDQPGQQRGGREHLRLREAETVRVLQRAVNRVQQQVQGDVVEHDGGEDLVAVELRFQQSRQQCPDRTGHHAGDQHQRQHPGATLAAQLQGRHAGPQRAHQEVSFGTDVPQLCPVTDGQAGGAEQQRCHLQAQLGPAVLVTQRGQEEEGQTFYRVLAEGHEDAHAGDDGEDQCQQRGSPLHGAGVDGATLKRQHGKPPKVRRWGNHPPSTGRVVQWSGRWC